MTGLQDAAVALLKRVVPLCTMEMAPECVWGGVETTLRPLPYTIQAELDGLRAIVPILRLLW